MTKEKIAIKRVQSQASLTLSNVSNLCNLKRAGMTVAVVVAGAPSCLISFNEKNAEVLKNC